VWLSHATVSVSAWGPQAKTRLERARALVDRLVAEDRVVYG